MKHDKLAIASVAVLVTLAACGGGGGGDEGGNPQSLDRAAKYVGEWKTACYPQSVIKDATTREAANVTYAVTFTRVDNNNLTFAYSFEVYASTDTTCSGASLGRIESTGVSSGVSVSGGQGVSASNGINQLKLEGTATVGGNTVDQFTETRPALTSGLGVNTNLTVGTGNRFTLNTADFQAKTYKNIAYAATNQFTLAEPSLTTYPTVLGTTAPFIYQKVATTTGGSGPANSPTN